MARFPVTRIKTPSNQRCLERLLAWHLVRAKMRSIKLTPPNTKLPSKEETTSQENLDCSLEKRSETLFPSDPLQPSLQRKGERERERATSYKQPTKTTAGDWSATNVESRRTRSRSICSCTTLCQLWAHFKLQRGETGWTFRDFEHEKRKRERETESALDQRNKLHALTIIAMTRF